MFLATMYWFQVSDKLCTCMMCRLLLTTIIAKETDLIFSFRYNDATVLGRIGS